MRIVRAVLFGFVSAIAALVATYALVFRPRIRSWGVDPSEVELPLPGDDLVSDPSAVETRGLTIAAPVAKVWPYLVQMGFGRAGWYSYDAMTAKGRAGEGILPEFQSLEEGDVVPTHPSGGFVVKSVEFERSLVLYTDAETMRSQAAEAKAAQPAEEPIDNGMRFGASYPDFAASWTFVLKPTEDGQTRLVERLRARTPGGGPASAVLGEVMGTGIVLLTRKQMLGIKERVESAPVEPAPVEPVSPPPAGSHDPQIEIPGLADSEPMLVN